MDFPAPRQRLYHLVHQETFDLAEAALCIAQEEYPQLQMQPVFARLDQMAEQVRGTLPEAHYPLKWLQCINRYLFEKLGFCGNTQDYYDPRNSFLNDVLERRTGIPITLSLVYLELSRRLDFPMVGIKFPGHFLIRPDRTEMEIFVDPFHQGEILFEQDCRDRLVQLYQRPITLQPEFFEPIHPHQFLSRMLTNLKHIYLNAGDVTKCLAASERILLIQPENLMEKRDRGFLYYRMGRWTEARQDFEEYLAHDPPEQDRAIILQLLNGMAKNQ
jgi:regulator of sirC expression with transglutaminase-like and TPR domain